LWKFLTNKVFTRQQGGWYIQYSSINYKIYYRPGKTNGKADALSRNPRHKSENHNTKIDLQNIEFPITILPTEYFKSEEKPQLINLSAIQQTQFKDPFKNKCRNTYTKEELNTFRGNIGHTDIYEEDGLFFIYNKLHPPATLYNEIITKEHNTGHWGRDKTIDLINRNFTIPGLHNLVIDKISKCDTCQRNKSLKHKRYGLLDPLDLPNRPRESISMDFIVKLPKTRKGNEHIWVVVDRFTELAHFIPLPNTKALELVKKFLKEIWRLHGLPEDIISDRDSYFTGHWW
jgi:hypothetical protein